MQENDRNSLDRYIEEICREQVLTADEERDLSVRIARGDSKAAEKLVTANLRFVISIANKYRGRGVAVEDLVSEGNIALMDVARKFDASRSRFVSYAVPVVRRAMENAIETQGQLYRVPRGEATAAEKRRSRALSVDAPLGGRENISLLSLLVNPNAPEADAQFEADARGSVLGTALVALDERERKVVAALFGVGCERLTMAEVAAEMGLKRERVRQIRDKAVRKLHKQLKTSNDR